MSTEDKQNIFIKQIKAILV